MQTRIQRPLLLIATCQQETSASLCLCVVISVVCDELLVQLRVFFSSCFPVSEVLECVILPVLCVHRQKPTTYDRLLLNVRANPAKHTLISGGCWCSFAPVELEAASHISFSNSLGFSERGSAVAVSEIHSHRSVEWR